MHLITSSRPPFYLDFALQFYVIVVQAVFRNHFEFVFAVYVACALNILKRNVTVRSHMKVGSGTAQNCNMIIFMLLQCCYMKY